MTLSSRTKVSAALLSLAGAAGLALCAQFACLQIGGEVRAAEEPPHSAALDEAIVAAAKRHGVPEHLVRRIIMRESKYNPRARNRLYWGLMQISYPTARSMGFKGTPEELLNPVVNLRYAVPYLANAFIIAGRREDAAVRLYAAGYYFTARSRGLLSAMRTADSAPLNGVVEELEAPILAANAVVQPPQSVGIFGALFGPGSQPQPTPAAAPVQVAAYSADATPGAPAPQTAAAGQTTPAQAVAPAPGTFNGASVAMVADKTGKLAPPKKWARDGGTTLFARGEQGLDQLAARDQGTEDMSGKSRRRGHKLTAVAALDLPPSSAQAYAGASQQDPRFAAAPSQAAIDQATAGQAAAAAQPSAAQVDANGQPIAAAAQPVAPTPAVDETPAKTPRARHARRKASDSRTREARAEKTATDAPPAPAVAQ